MSIPVTSIGAKIKIGASVEKGGERPSVFNNLPMVYSFPELSFTPSVIDTTTYDNEKYKTAVAGLIEAGSIQTIEAFYSDELVQAWNESCEAYNEGKNVWLCIEIPRIGQAYYIPVAPLEASMPTVPLNDAVKQKLMFTICGDIDKQVLVA